MLQVLAYPTVPVWTTVPFGNVISGILAPRVAELRSARFDILTGVALDLVPYSMTRTMFRFDQEIASGLPLIWSLSFYSAYWALWGVRIR